MAILQKTVRSAAIVLAVVFSVVSAGGLLGIWWVDREATEFARQAFGRVAAAVGLVGGAVERMHGLIETSRAEVRQATETITAAGARIGSNRPLLDALPERLETSLSPRLAQLQQVMLPVRDAVGTIGQVVSLLNSFPRVAESAPRLADLDATFERLEALSADSIELRRSLRALLTPQPRDLPAEAVAALHALAQRIDRRLGEVEDGVREMRTHLTALQARLSARQSRILWTIHLLALLATLFLAWILYSQIVVIRHHRRRAA